MDVVNEIVIWLQVSDWFEIGYVYMDQFTSYITSSDLQKIFFFNILKFKYFVWWDCDDMRCWFQQNRSVIDLILAVYKYADIMDLLTALIALSNSQKIYQYWYQCLAP